MSEWFLYKDQIKREQNLEFHQHRLSDYCQRFHKGLRDPILSVGVIYLFLEVKVKPFLFLKIWKIKYPLNKWVFYEDWIKINQDLGSLCQCSNDPNCPHTYSLSSPLLPCPLNHSITVTRTSSNTQIFPQSFWIGCILWLECSSPEKDPFSPSRLT